jgi:hypothetical protein
MAANKEDLKDAREQLNLVLSFFPRVDGKLSTILAINTGMLGALAASTPSLQNTEWWLAIAPVITFILLFASYVNLYRGGFPDVKGGRDSIVYFGEISRRTESKFIEAYISQSDDALRRELLGQVWRNSEILREKYTCLKLAFQFMAGAVAPWALTLALFAVEKANFHFVVTHP